MGDVVQNDGDVLLPAVAVRAHQSHVLLKAGLSVILFHTGRGLLPQLVGSGGYDVTGQDSGGYDEVSRLNNGDFDSPGFHLIAEAVGEGFDAILGDAIRRAHDVADPSVHAGQVDDAACVDTDVSESAGQNLSRCVFVRVGTGNIPRTVISGVDIV